MRCARSAGGSAGPASAPYRCSATAPTTTTSTAAWCASAASDRSSPAGAPPTARASDASAGWSSGPSPTCTGSDGFASAGTVTPRCTPPSCSWPARTPRPARILLGVALGERRRLTLALPPRRLKLRTQPHVLRKQPLVLSRKRPLGDIHARLTQPTNTPLRAARPTPRTTTHACNIPCTQQASCPTPRRKRRPQNPANSSTPPDGLRIMRVWETPSTVGRSRRSVGCPARSGRTASPRLSWLQRLRAMAHGRS